MQRLCRFGISVKLYLKVKTVLFVQFFHWVMIKTSLGFFNEPKTLAYLPKSFFFKRPTNIKLAEIKIFTCTSKTETEYYAALLPDERKRRESFSTVSANL